jgi:hypothetical protein
MNNHDVSIIIQGPTQYYEEIIEVYKDVDNVLWCTWDDEPLEVINSIKEVGIFVHLISKPLNPGYWNINLQCKSTYEGLLKCKELFDSKYYIKIRSDFKITDVTLLLERFITKNEKINFLGWADRLEFFFLDYIVFGDFYSMQKYWNFQDDKNNGYPCPEIFLMNRFFGNECCMHGLKTEYISKLPLLNGIDLYWLSRGINIRDFSTELEFNYTEKRFFYYLKFKIKNLTHKIRNLINKIKNE